MRRAHLARLDERRGVEDLRTGVFRKAHKESAARTSGLELGKARVDGQAKPAMEQQVLGRISRERELGQHQQVRVELAAGTLRGGDDALRVTRDVAHEQVELPEGDAQFLVRGHLLAREFQSRLSFISTSCGQGCFIGG